MMIMTMIMMMINKKNGELITCAFNVFHTNFLIKHNCVLTEPSTFLFFFQIILFPFRRSHGIRRRYLRSRPFSLNFQFSQSIERCNDLPHFCIFAEPMRIVNVQTRRRIVEHLGKVVTSICDEPYLWVSNIIGYYAVIHFRDIITFTRGIILFPCVRLGHTTAASIAICNGASEGSRSVQRRGVTTTPYRLSRAELFRRSASAITLLLARNNAAAAEQPLTYVAATNILVVLRSNRFHRTTRNNNSLFQARVIFYGCDRLAEIWECGAIFEMNFWRIPDM